MTLNDPAILKRYAAIIRSLADDPPRENRVEHNRPIHAALDQSYRREVTAGSSERAGPFLAADGQTLATDALLSAAGDRALIEAIIQSQQPSGEFLITTARDNPEPHWYHELILLHAVAHYAQQTNRPAAWESVERAAEFHLNETQPDHATAEPWALFAFIRYADTLPLADLMLHTVQAQHPAGLDRVSWMLLRDALYCLHLTINDPGQP